MDNKVVQTIARTLAGLGYGVARFNFRGVGASAGSFDDGVGETDDAIAVLDHLRGKFGQLPVVLSGFSFGSFVQARLYQREKERVQIERLLFVGLTANRIGPDALPPDTILIHGEQDEIVPLADVFSWARPQLLPVIVFPGCGHFFHGRLLQLQQVIEGVWR
jgi:alpha/beta superfamily hydrolase